MKKIYLLPILFALCACGSNSSISSSVSTSTSSSSNSISSSSNISTTSTTTSVNTTTSSSSVDKYKNVLNKDLQCILNETKDGYIIYKYLKYDRNIRLPETFSGLFDHKYDNDNKGWHFDVYSGNSMYDENVLTLPIVGILDNAFQSSGGVENIYFGDSYVEFEHSAFFGCTTIKNYEVSKTHPLFKSIDGVLYTKDGEGLFAYPLGRRDTYNVVDGTKKILSESFQYSNVVEVNIPESVEEIGSYAFSNAKRLKKINIPSKVQEIKEETFSTCIELKTINFSEGLEKIGYNAFWQCEKINALNFPTSLREIGVSAFEGVGSSTSGIKDLVFSEGLEYIGDFAFAYNEYIETITFPTTLKTIGKYAFMQNYRTEEIVLNEGLKVLEEGAFFYNLNLRKVTFSSTLEEIGFNAFATSETNPIHDGIEEYIVPNESNHFKNVDGVVYSKDGKELVIAPAGLTYENGHYTVLDGTEKINDHAFYNSVNLRSITFPNSLKEIGKAPFFLSNLKSISYLGTMDEFGLIKTVDEIFTSDNSTDVLKVKWYQTSDYVSISTVTCSDGVLKLF